MRSKNNNNKKNFYVNSRFDHVTFFFKLPALVDSLSGYREKKKKTCHDATLWRAPTFTKSDRFNVLVASYDCSYRQQIYDPVNGRIKKKKKKKRGSSSSSRLPFCVSVCKSMALFFFFSLTVAHRNLYGVNYAGRSYASIFVGLLPHIPPHPFFFKFFYL